MLHSYKCKAQVDLVPKVLQPNQKLFSQILASISNMSFPFLLLEKPEKKFHPILNILDLHPTRLLPEKLENFWHGSRIHQSLHMFSNLQVDIFSPEKLVLLYLLYFCLWHLLCSNHPPCFSISTFFCLLSIQEPHNDHRFQLQGCPKIIDLLKEGFMWLPLDRCKIF